MRIKNKYWLILLIFCFAGCYRSDQLNVPEKEFDDDDFSELDRYINENFTEPYGITVRYRYSDDFINFGQRTVPVKVELVRPMLDFLQTYWIDPYLEVENGREFFIGHVPAEVVLLGGQIFDGGGVVLGFAEAGARITVLDVNTLDLEDDDWVRRQLNIIYHEFAHVVHQKHNMPSGFETITPTGYTGPGSWFTLTNEDALERGFVTPYSTQDVQEDFAELISFYLFEPEFDSLYLQQEFDCETADCERRNEGRQSISEKLSNVSNHYGKVTGIDLDLLREATQSAIVGE